MKIFSVLCTRDKNLAPVTERLVHTLSSYGVDVKIMANQKSIFEAYEKGIAACEAKDEDIIICCHDDIEIKSSRAAFIAALSICTRDKTGLVGPAGTTYLGEDAVWWNHSRWQAGYHRGLVCHPKDPKPEEDKPRNFEVRSSHYGPHGQVVALDGLFLAATKKVWKAVGLKQPSYFEGAWDFYDIHYTTKAHQLGYKNYTVPIDMVHHSIGELVGRDSWHKNRAAFIANMKLPLSC